MFNGPPPKDKQAGVPPPPPPRRADMEFSEQRQDEAQKQDTEDDCGVFIAGVVVGSILF